jgi:hypothetical protein
MNKKIVTLFCCFILLLAEYVFYEKRMVGVPASQITIYGWIYLLSAFIPWIFIIYQSVKIKQEIKEKINPGLLYYVYLLYFILMLIAGFMFIKFLMYFLYLSSVSSFVRNFIALIFAITITLNIRNWIKENIKHKQKPEPYRSYPYHHEDPEDYLRGD